ncbi:LacI family DNA-binding transcriptional regulator [Enterococcus sp. LJL128]|uniref:LacI family DNA-binding transcriptional regulator n=1 Tax=Enterococcus sp. LJL51 TaxID=3416656 RepID=UPI003CED5A33
MKLEDIARIANVSKSAASLALNGKPGVSEETRKAILEVAEKYEYSPLRRRIKKEENRLKIRFIACTNEDVVPENYDQLPFFKELLSYISTEIGAKGHILTTNSLPKEALFSELSLIEELDTSDGIIILGTNLTAAHIKTVNEHFNNLVILDTQCSSLDCNTITMNNFLGAYDATQHLLKMGHQNIGYIKGIQRINNFYDRRRGFKAAISAAGLSPSDMPKFYLPGMEINPIQNKQEQFLDFIKGITAVFCEDDYIAISVIKTLSKIGIRIPEDLSVIGFDDISESRVITPELTTVHVPIKEIAQEAISLIEQGTTATLVKKQLFLNTKLICRDSVKKMN